MSTHVNVIILTPGNSMLPSYVNSLLATGAEFNKRGITWYWATGYASHVADAREITLSGQYQNILSESRPFNGNMTYDKLLWIDSDIAWKPEDAIKLYESDKEIISGAYLFANGVVAAYPEFMGQGYGYSDVMDMEDVVEIQGCGFGFVAIKRGVFESLSRPWFQPVIGSKMLDGELITIPIIGEDLSLCKRAMDVGFKIYFDPTVKVTHHKNMKLTWEGIKP